MKTQHILEIRNLTKNYGKFCALNNVTFSIEEGIIVGLLGKNGSGKTTLMKTILGLLCKYDGEILFQGKNIEHQNPEVMSKIRSLVDIQFYEDMTAYENLNYLLMMKSEYNRGERSKKIDELLQMVGLFDNRNDKVKTFSFGMKQRLALAQVFLHEAALIILDEPFVGLDPVGIEFMKNILRKMKEEKGITVIFSSHQLEEVGDLADKIVAITEGTVKYNGTLEELEKRNKKYHIWINGRRDPIVIPYDSKSLQELIYGSGDKEVDRIEVIENGLYQLFCDGEKV